VIGRREQKPDHDPGADPGPTKCVRNILQFIPPNSRPILIQLRHHLAIEYDLI